MGAVESLDHCCNDRSDEKKTKVFGTWRTPPTSSNKNHKTDLNRDYGNGAGICAEPLKDLKLDKSIDAEVAVVFKEVGHRFPCPIHGQDQLTKILGGFRKRGYVFPGTDAQLCAKVWAAHNTSCITILQFRSWLQNEVVVSKNNLQVLLGHSRWVAALVKRVHDESELADDKLDCVREVVNNLRRYLEEESICVADIQKTLGQVIERSGRANYFFSGRGKILTADFEALVTELLAQMYYDHFSASLYSFQGQATGDDSILKTKTKKHFPGALSSTHCCLPTTESGMDTWRRVSDALPVGDEPKALKSKSLSRKTLPDRRTVERSLKFPIGSTFPYGAAIAA